MMNEDLAQAVKAEVPLLRKLAELREIHKGYSPDRKFEAAADGRRYLLRIYEQRLVARKQEEFKILQELHERHDVRCSRPLGIGMLSGLGLGYMLLTYIEGEDAVDELPRLSKGQQYDIGYDAGSQLRRMHQIQAPDSVAASWAQRSLAKHRKYVDEYSQTETKIERGDRVLGFIEEHLHLLQHRPVSLQHDDFHTGNLIIKDGCLAGIIDFNRFDWGDPYQEFMKTGMFSSEVSIPFAVGQIRGYFQGREPDELFWTLYSMYIAMCLISSVVWIKKVKPEETGIMMEKINRVLADHNDFQAVIPQWYSNYQ
ncbi:aminoglycoside phosphotransferase [Paenibacillus sp. CAA11]|uniref:phosphotransferase family protein n=1 Tax=Paenibacillus sp. CAA11 TaxID=1532905 RepID=UPI000D3856A2|nr:aminoglycoside phosphotransferase family protein [Paenibacillus sp. CAA11]AWB44519.1 aminoglycoside phosphotransferase [Paenibacillus sp. CAA11]